MRSLSSLGICLSLVFGCLLLALLAELYYVLWWKKRLHREMEDEYSSSLRELLYLFCWRKPASLSSAAVNPQEISSSGRNSGAHNLHEQNQQSGANKDLPLKQPFGEESVESEIMRLHHLSGPPRFLFTIKEETKEDLESEDGRSRCGRSRKGSRTKSMSDLVVAVETPFATPLSSPPFLTPPVTPRGYHHSNFPFPNGFNPLFESSIEGELNRWRSSPPPTFKFLRDAEEKLCRKLMEAQMICKNFGFVSEEKVSNPKNSSGPSAKEEEGSFITIIINKAAENQQIQQPPSGSSQVLPLQSSPPESTIPVGRKPMFH